MPARNEADPDSEWDRHKPRIEALYIEQNFKLGDLIDIMVRHHNFEKR